MTKKTDRWKQQRHLARCEKARLRKRTKQVREVRVRDDKVSSKSEWGGLAWMFHGVLAKALFAKQQSMNRPKFVTPQKRG